MMAAFENALNPTTKLASQLTALEAAGKTSGDIMSVLGDRIKTATATATAHGQPVADIVAKYNALTPAVNSSSLSFESLGKTIQNAVNNPMGAMKEGLTGILGSLGPVALGIGAMASAAAAAGVAIFSMISSMADEMEQLENLSAKTGVSTQALEAYQQMAKEAGLESLDLGRTIVMLNKALGDDKPNEFTKAMQALGVSTKYASGETKSAEDALDDMRLALLAIENPHERAQKAAQIFSGRLADLGVFLQKSNVSLRDGVKAMDEYGIVTDETAKKQLATFDAAMDKLGTTLAGVWHQFKIGMMQIPGIGEAIDILASNTENVSQKTKWWGDDIGKVNEKLAEYDRQQAAKKIKEQEEATKKAAEEAKRIKENQDKWNESLREYKERQDRAWESGENERKLVQYLIKYYDECAIASKEFGKAAADAHKKAADSAEEMYWTTVEAIRKSNDAKLDDLLDMGKDWAKASEGMTNAEIKTHDSAAKEVGSIWQKQVSTIVTDFSAGVADIILEGKGFATTMKGIFEDFGKSVLRTLIEQLFTPLTNWIKGLVSQITGIGGSIIGGGGGGSTGGGGIFAGLGKAGSNIFGGIDLSSLLPALGGAFGGYAAAGTPGMVGGFLTAELLSNIGASMSAGLGAGAGLGGFASALAAIGPWGWAALAGVAALGPIISAIKGKDAWTAGSMEVARDFGGVEVPKGTFASWAQGLGISESMAWPIRKDLLSSPKFLTEVAWPLALLQNKVNPFVSSLGAVSTAWGSGDFRTPFELWLSKGDASGLNSAYSSLFGPSKALASAIPDWASRLAASNLAGFVGGTDTGGPTDRGVVVPGTRRYEKGGYVDETGLAVVHKGEYVIPANRAASVTINLHISALDGASVAEVTKRKVIPAILDAIAANSGGSRTGFNRALAGQRV